MEAGGRAAMVEPRLLDSRALYSPGTPLPSWKQSNSSSLGSEALLLTLLGSLGKAWRNEGDTSFSFTLGCACIQVVGGCGSSAGVAVLALQLSSSINKNGQALIFGKYKQSLSAPSLPGFHLKMMSGSLLAPVGNWSASAESPTCRRVLLGMLVMGRVARLLRVRGRSSRAGQPLSRPLESA